MKLFEEEDAFGHKTVVDAPQGRYTGLEQIRGFAERWLESLGAERAYVEPIRQTVGGGCSASEVIVHYWHAGEKYAFPMYVIGDITRTRKLTGFRIYFFFRWIPGISGYRPPVFRPNNGKAANWHAMSGAFKEYYINLNREDKSKEERLEIMRQFLSEDIHYSGYYPDSYDCMMRGKKDVMGHFTVNEYVRLPSQIMIQMENLIDDGVDAIMEWTNLITPESEEKFGWHSQGGIAGYETGKDGKLKSIRICDNVGFENTKHPDQEFETYYIDKDE